MFFDVPGSVLCIAFFIFLALPLSIAIFLAMIPSMIRACNEPADDGKLEPSELKWEENDGTLVVTGHRARAGSFKTLTVPSELGGRPVVGIGRSAFADCVNLTSVTLPDTIATIGEYAFAGCRSLESVALPKSLTTIVENAFLGCSNLASVVLPDALETLGYPAFEPTTTLCAAPGSSAEKAANAAGRQTTDHVPETDANAAPAPAAATEGRKKSGVINMVLMFLALLAAIDVTTSACFFQNRRLAPINFQWALIEPYVLIFIGIRLSRYNNRKAILTLLLLNWFLWLVHLVAFFL